MKSCIRCSQAITPGNNFCQTCGADQRGPATAQQGGAGFLIALCVITIVGSIFVIARAFFYEMISMIGGETDYLRGWAYLVSGIGTLTGAIMMIQRKLKGLYVYSFFQVLYILSVAWAVFSYSGLFSEAGQIAAAFSGFFVIPALVFLILFWIDLNRKHLY